MQELEDSQENLIMNKFLLVPSPSALFTLLLPPLPLPPILIPSRWDHFFEIGVTH
ncbi:BnaC02g03530D [Brassica napus]|uniref:BnaC02g03530D protein n=1 Tax=Brassica napus TaxID=3708 RepID=A0A078IDS2_BRANA|nr:BnaC02g03530D [Brassica napus]